MKYLAILSFFLLSASAYAQEAKFKSADAKQPAGIHTRFNCTLTGLSDPDQAQKIIAAMKATPGLLKLDLLKSTANTADILIITQRDNDIVVLQNALTAANVSRISVDEKSFKTARLSKVIGTQK